MESLYVAGVDYKPMRSRIKCQFDMNNCLHNCGSFPSYFSRKHSPNSDEN